MSSFNLEAIEGWRQAVIRTDDLRKGKQGVVLDKVEEFTPRKEADPGELTQGRGIFSLKQEKVTQAVGLKTEQSEKKTHRRGMLSQHSMNSLGIQLR